MENSGAKHGNSNGCLIALVVLVLVLPLCCAAVMCGSLAMGASVLSAPTLDVGSLGDAGSLEELIGFDGATATADYSDSFSVDGAARVVVDVSVGSVTVIVGDDDEIQVEAEITAYGGDEDDAEEALDQVRLDVEASGRELEITGIWPASLGAGGSRSPKIDVTLTVPEEAALEIEMDVASIKVTGTRGDVDIRADIGEVVLRDVRVTREATIDTDVASVDFRGALTEGATYEFTSDLGEISVRLPDDSSFAIDAKSDVGDVDVAFDVDGETERSFLTKSVTGVVGDDDGTRLILRSSVGAISVRSM